MSEDPDPDGERSTPGMPDIHDLDPRILNDGLALAMEWGEHWLSPIQERLARVHPGLSPEDLDRYDETCRAAMDHGHALVAALVTREGLQPGEALRTRFQAQALERDPWMSDDNLGALYSQSCYYAMK